MTPFRLARWILLIAALLASIGWAYYSINQLLKYSMNEQEREAEYSTVPQAPSAHLHEMDLAQRYWGRRCMFAIACSFGFLLALMMNWVLDGRPRQNRKVNRELN